jgi:CspA family cold shock protein
MATGTVKWFPTKGYGFIQPQGGGKDCLRPYLEGGFRPVGRNPPLGDILCRRLAQGRAQSVEKAGLSTLNEGQKVEYEEVESRGKTSAENLKVK